MSAPCRAELLAGADEQDRGIYGGDPPSGEEAVYAAKARAAGTVGGTVGVLGDALMAMGTDGPICTDCECWPARRAPLPPDGRSNCEEAFYCQRRNRLRMLKDDKAAIPYTTDTIRMSTEQHHLRKT